MQFPDEKEGIRKNKTIENNCLIFPLKNGFTMPANYSTTGKTRHSTQPHPQRPHAAPATLSEIIIRINFVKWILALPHNSVKLLVIDDPVSIPVSLVNHFL